MHRSSFWQPETVYTLNPERQTWPEFDVCLIPQTYQALEKIKGQPKIEVR